jgi:3-oxoacyl-(acyl-carrier-protein) synthase
MNENIGYSAISAVDAWKDAGFTVPPFDSDVVDWDSGIIVGSGIGGMDTIANIVVPMVTSGKVKRMGSSIVEQVMNSGTSARVGGLLALGNQVTSNSSACSTGNEAIFESMMRIRTGLAKRILAGGCEGSWKILKQRKRGAPVFMRNSSEDTATAAVTGWEGP